MYTGDTILKIVQEDSLMALTPRKLYYITWDMNAVARDMIDCIFQLHFYALYLIAIENTVKALEIGYRLNYRKLSV